MQDTWQLPLGNLTLSDHLELLDEQPEARYHESKLAKSLGLCLRLIGSMGSFPVYSMPRAVRWAAFCGMDLWECDMPASHCQAMLGYALDHSIAPGPLEAFASTEQFPAEHATAPSEGHQASDELARLRQRPGRVDEGAWDRHATGTAGRPQAGYDVRA